MNAGWGGGGGELKQITKLYETRTYCEIKSRKRDHLHMYTPARTRKHTHTHKQTREHTCEHARARTSAHAPARAHSW